MTDKMTTSMFIKELRKTIPAEDLISQFTKYLDEVGDHCVMRYLFEAYQSTERLKEFNISEDDREIIISCHSVFQYSQRLTDSISSRLDPYEERTTDLMVSLVLYGSVYEVLKSEMSDVAGIIRLYEEVCMSMNSPRADIEEAPVLIRIRSSYYMDFYLPLELFGISSNVSEDLYILYYLSVKDVCEDLKEYYCRKVNINSKREDILMKIESDNNRIVHEILNMTIVD